MTLNDPQFVEGAKMLAATTLQSSTDDAARVNSIAQRVLARPFKAEEQAIVLDSLNQLRAAYKSDKAAAEQLLAVGQAKAPEGVDVQESAAWTMLINQIMNLDEALNK